MGSDDEDGGDSEDYRCSYRCAACRSASHVHLTNLSEDDADARSSHSKKKVIRALSADDMFEQQRCQYRCAACRSLLSSHWPVPNAVNEDDEDARAAKHLLALRSR